MIDGLVRLLVGSAVQGAGFGAGAEWASRLVRGNPPKQIWTGTVRDVTFMVMGQQVGRRIRYDLHAVGGGQNVCAGSFWEYPEVVAAVQTWEQFVLDGGTVQSWAQRYSLPSQENGR